MFNESLIIFLCFLQDNSSVPALGLKPRLGSEKDKNDLKKTLSDLDFDVHAYDNLTSSQFWKVIKEGKTQSF